MIDSLPKIGLIAIGSLVWLVVQTISWTTLIRLDSDGVFRRLMKWSPIVAPVFVLALLAVAKFAGSKVSVLEFVFIPLATSWICFLSLSGLLIAASRVQQSHERSKR